jgi:hypothetical protein
LLAHRHPPENCYFTVSKTVTECCSVPEVPVTVMVKVRDAGVVFAAGNPPLQLAKPRAAASSRLTVTRCRRLLVARNENKQTNSRVIAMAPSSSNACPGDRKDIGMTSATPAGPVTVIVVVAGVAVGVTDVGWKLTVVPVGTPAAVKVTALLNEPPIDVAAIVYVAGWPAETVCEGVWVATEKSNPVPVSPMDCGLPGALSVMVTEPLRAPLVVGVNVMFSVHVAFTATLIPQLSVSAKSPECAMAEIASAAAPLSESVTD